MSRRTADASKAIRLAWEKEQQRVLEGEGTRDWTEKQQQDIVKLQRKILSVVWEYVKPGGILVYSTCTIGADENQYNIKWFLENFPFRLESIDPYICDSLKGKTTKGGYIQLLPGVHKSDGFFIARLRRIDGPEDDDFYFDEE